MSKQITKIELDGKIIFSKPLLLNDTLDSLREKIKEKVKISYKFLDKEGKDINFEKEKDYKLEDISVEKIVKIVSIKEENNGPNINVYINNKNICFLNLKNDQKLDEVRSLICDKIEKKI